MKSSTSYIVVTAAKNEEENLPDCIISMANQTIKPKLWAIVNDGSTDNTLKIIEEAKRKYPWIQSINLKEEPWDLMLHLSFVIKTVFDFATRYCIEHGISYDYLGNIDGDISIEPAFFEKLILEFEKDPFLGIAGSGTQYIIGGQIVQPKAGVDHPSGGDMLIRRKCFEDCGGILLKSSWDSALKAKARLREWKTKRFEYIKALEKREPKSGIGLWNGYKRHGRTSYYFNRHPIISMLRGLRLIFIKPHYIGIAFLIGYTSAFIKKGKQIEDNEIKEYYGGTKYIIRSIKSIINTWFLPGKIR